MTFRNTWWCPNYKEYGSGRSNQVTWQEVQEQYRRPSILHDLRYYDLPVNHNLDMLHYRHARFGMPEYRGTFRDKPHTVQKYYPDVEPTGKPAGFYGRMYYEDDRFKYGAARKKDDLYWLERNPHLPPVIDERSQSARKSACRSVVPYLDSRVCEKR